MTRPTAFFAYPSKPPTLVETINNAIAEINATNVVHVRSWQENPIGGKLLIQPILDSIDQSDLFLADLTGFNPNVMFELGYAVGRGKRIWVVLDTSLQVSTKDYDRLQVLTGVGYASYTNAWHIVTHFLREEPYRDLQSSIFATHVEPVLNMRERASLLYLKSLYETEPSRKLSELVDRFGRGGLPCTIDDPAESRLNPLAWYGQKVYSALGVLAHLCSEEREGCGIHNARYSFVCGLAQAFGKPVLIVADTDQPAPIDYQHLVVRCRTARECVGHAREFLEKVAEGSGARRASSELRLEAIDFRTRLKELYLGEHVAENEADLLGRYFVETAAYQDALQGRHTVFVGRKGSGKTANLLRVATELEEDHRNLVVVIKPVGYNLESVVRLLGKYRRRDTKGYLVESLWKFLLMTEVARAATLEIEKRPRAAWTDVQAALVEFVDGPGTLVREDFAVRLERAIESLLPIEDRDRIEETRVAISEALHGGLLRDLRRVLGNTLVARERVAVLVDNLDKAWEPNGDIAELTALLLGLLGAAGRLPIDFRKEDDWRKPVNLTLTIFLRSDIFDHLLRAAREPDKIPYWRIMWNDPELLLRVVEQRFAASVGANGDPRELWPRYFVATMRGQSTREYLASRVLPRPRDIVYLCRAAVAVAVNRGHSRVVEDDIVSAEEQYSQYALDTIEVEARMQAPNVEAVLFEFIGSPEILAQQDVEVRLARAGVKADQQPQVVDQLVALSFLGVEVQKDVFDFPSDEIELKKDAVLVRNLLGQREGPRRYRIHPAFHSFLQVVRDQ